jgi:P2-related tail formation protein
VFVEASDKSVSRWLAQLTEERKETIIKEAAEKQEAKE